jgi:hypothetical protein
MKLIPSICDHHKSTYTNRFTSFRHSKKCDNPFNNHSQSKKPLAVRIVYLSSCVKVSSKSNLHFYPGQHLCIDCDKQLHLLISNNDDENQSLITEENLNDDKVTQVIIIIRFVHNKHKHFTKNIIFVFLINKNYICLNRVLFQL